MSKTWGLPKHSKHLCSWPGCPVVCEPGGRLCRVHRKEMEEELKRYREQEIEMDTTERRNHD